MLTSKRNMITIMVVLLKLMDGINRTTHLMYKANISFYQLRYYLTVLKDAELYTTNNDNRCVITEKGKYFIELFEHKQEQNQQ